MKKNTVTIFGALAGVAVIGSLVYLMAPEEQAPDMGERTEQQSPERPGVAPAPAMAAAEAGSGNTPERADDGAHGDVSLEDRLRAGDADLLEKYGFGERELALSRVDLEALKEKMPGNLYWQMGAPTQDESVRQERKEMREYWRQQENRIAANLAEEYAIRDYYMYQNALSEDYVAITDELLKNYGGDLSEQDYGLLLMANRLHAARLQEIPKQLATALDDRRDFVARKESWQEDPQAYEEALRLEREAALQELASHSSESPSGAN